MAFQMVCSLLVQMFEEACNHEWAEDCDNEFILGNKVSSATSVLNDLHEKCLLHLCATCFCVHNNY